MESIADQLMAEAADRGIIAPVIPVSTDVKPGENADPAPAPAPNPTPAPAPEIDEEAALKFLQARNPNIKSLADVLPKPAEPTEAEKLAQQANKKDEVLKFALDKQLYKSEDYENYLAYTQKEKSEVVYESFKADVLNENPELDEDEIKDAFNEKYNLLEATDSWKYKNGQKRLADKADAVVKSKFKNVVEAESAFDNHRSTIEKETTYTREIDSVFTSKAPKEVTFTLDGQTYTEKIPDDFLNNSKKSYLTKPMMEALLSKDGKVDADLIAQEIRKDFITENYSSLVQSVAKRHAQHLALADKAGRRNITLSPDEVNLEAEKRSSVKGESDIMLEEAREKGMIK